MRLKRNVNKEMFKNKKRKNTRSIDRNKQDKTCITEQRSNKADDSYAYYSEASGLNLALSTKDSEDSNTSNSSVKSDEICDENISNTTKNLKNFVNDCIADNQNNSKNFVNDCINDDQNNSKNFVNGEEKSKKNHFYDESKYNNNFEKYIAGDMDSKKILFETQTLHDFYLKENINPPSSLLIESMLPGREIQHNTDIILSNIELSDSPLHLDDDIQNILVLNTHNAVNPIMFESQNDCKKASIISLIAVLFGSCSLLYYTEWVYDSSVLWNNAAILAITLIHLFFCISLVFKKRLSLISNMFLVMLVTYLLVQLFINRNTKQIFVNSKLDQNDLSLHVKNLPSKKNGVILIFSTDDSRTDQLSKVNNSINNIEEAIMTNIFKQFKAIGDNQEKMKYIDVVVDVSTLSENDIVNLVDKIAKERITSKIIDAVIHIKFNKKVNIKKFKEYIDFN